MTKKICSRCKRMLNNSEFYVRSNSNLLDSWCKECTIKYQMKRYNTDQKEINNGIKLETMIYFGGQCVYMDNGIQCPMNAVDNLDYLDLSHPNHDGNEHRSLISNEQGGCVFYKALKKRNWNTDGFVVQVMCKSHHRNFDQKGTEQPKGKLSPKYKKGKFNNKDWLKKKYETMTLQEIADECGVCRNTIGNRMKEFGCLRKERRY